MESSGDAQERGGWQMPAAVFAALFLNLAFWDVAGRWFGGPPRLLFGAPGLLAGVVFGLFYLGPALAVQRRQTPLFEVMEESFGVVPAAAIRVLCAILCVVWVSTIPSVAKWVFRTYAGTSGLSGIEPAALAMVVTLFVFATAERGLLASGKMALFTSKLGIALLIAGALRVREYWPEVWTGFVGDTVRHGSVWHMVSEAMMIAVPMALLAADLGGWMRSSKDVLRAGIAGLMVPLLLAIPAVSLMARGASHTGSPGSIVCALWCDMTVRYQVPWMAAATMTMFGWGRFGVTMFGRALALDRMVRRKRLGVVVIGWAAVVALCSWEPPVMGHALEAAAVVAAIAAAVLSADLVVGKRRPCARRMVDWVGLVVAASGLCAADVVGYFGGYGETVTFEILVPYGVSFGVCVVARGLENLQPLASRFLSQ